MAFQKQKINAWGMGSFEQTSENAETIFSNSVLPLGSTSNLSAGKALETILQKKQKNETAAEIAAENDLFLESLAGFSLDSGKLGGRKEVVVDYSFPQEEAVNFLGYQEQAIKLDYEMLWYDVEKYKKRASASLQEEEESTVAEDTEAEVTSVQEAQHSFERTQYAFLVGASTELNFKDRRKLALKLIFQRDLLALWESSFALTREVDYRFSL